MMWTILAVLAVILTTAALLASAISAAVYRGFLCVWPFAFGVCSYVVAWFYSPPPPVSAWIGHAGLSGPDLIRYAGFAVALVWWSRDYRHALKEIDRLNKKANTLHVVIRQGDPV